MVARTISRNLMSWQATLRPCFIDVVDDLFTCCETAGIDQAFIRGNSLSWERDHTYSVVISGWAGHPLARRGRVRLSIGESRTKTVIPHRIRKDVGRFFGTSRAPRCGFRVRVRVSGHDLDREPGVFSLILETRQGPFAIHTADRMAAAPLVSDHEGADLDVGGFVDDVRIYRTDRHRAGSGWMFAVAGHNEVGNWLAALMETGRLPLARAMIWHHRTDRWTREPSWAGYLFDVHADLASADAMEIHQLATVRAAFPR